MSWEEKQTTEEMCDNYLAYNPNAGTPETPNFFTACIAYEKGILPQYFNDIDDYTPFAIMDLAGDLFMDQYESDPTNNLAPCCAQEGAAACEAQFLAKVDEPCGLDKDCQSGLTCKGGLCFRTADGNGASGDIGDVGGGSATSPPTPASNSGTKSLVVLAGVAFAIVATLV